jgi:enoyl-CoA hydratase
MFEPESTDSGDAESPNMPAATPVSLVLDGSLAVVTFSAPPLNLLDEAMLSGLETTLDTLGVISVGGLLVQSTGRIMTGGGDVRLFDGISAQGGATLFSRLLGIVHGVEALPFPTVFAAHALCLTWAFELALACDLILAAETASFGLVERSLGLTPSAGGTQRLAERAGSARAKELVLTGAIVDARAMNAWNIVNRVLPDEGFPEAARAFARELADGPTLAHAAAKRIVASYISGGIGAADAMVADEGGALFDSADARSAIAAFLTRDAAQSDLGGA